MRNIKFRGKKDNPYSKEWITGYYALQDGEHVIIMPHSSSYEKGLKENKSLLAISVAHNIDYKTLGQYTGLKDKNGVEIYEGDILKTHFIGGDGFDIKPVVFERGTFAVDYSEDYKPLLNEVNHYSEVIGNIYDNQELLKGSANDDYIKPR